MKDVHDLEVYACIDGFPNYLVTSKGRVLSLKNIKIKEIKPFKSKSGYYIVSIYKNKKSVHKSVHRLVAQSFIPNPDNKPQVNHIDENKVNNCVSNLEWSTASENINYGSRNEKVSQKNSISHKGKKLSNETKEKISKLNKGKGNPKAKSVIGFKIDGCDIKYYKYIGECKKDNFIPTCISDCCRNKRKSYKGYTWQYIDNKNED